MELFTDGIKLKTLNNKVDIHLLRKSLRKMKNEFLNNTILTNETEIERFKEYELKNLKFAIEKIQLPDEEFLNLELNINPYLIFTKTLLPENGKVESIDKEYNIVLQPKFLALGRPIFTPIYIYGYRQNLLKIRSLKNSFTGIKLVKERMSKESSDELLVIKNKISNLLREFMIFQFLTFKNDGTFKK